MGVWRQELCFQVGKESSETKESIFLQGGRRASMTAGGRQDNQLHNHGHAPKLML